MIYGKELNLYLSSSKKEKQSIFKTTQKDLKTIPSVINNYSHGLKNKKTNIIFSVKNYEQHLKTQYNNDGSKKFLLIDDSTLKMTTHLSNTIRYNHSILRFKHNNYSIQKYKSSITPYSRHKLIKINKPYLLRLLNSQKGYKTLKIKDSGVKSFIPSTASKTINDKNKTINNENLQINNLLSIKVNKIYKIKELYQKMQYNDKYDTQRNLLKSFKKMKELKISFPLEFLNNSSFEKSELRDKVNIDYFNDEKMKKKIRKTLYYDINSFDYDNGNYWDYKKSIPNFFNFIFDINILPHLKNKFLYNKSINKLSKQTQINEIILNRNAISKVCAEALNRYIINNIKKEILEKEEIKKRENKIRELAKSNKILLKLYMEQKDEELPDLTNEEIVELNDYFGKNINYKDIKIANNRLRRIVYENKNFFKKKSKYK